MKLSIVIPVLNEETYIGLILSDLAMQLKISDEVIVVDGGSSDLTRRVVKKFKFAKLVDSKRGVAVQRNRGGRETSGDVVIFMDADVRVSLDFLERVRREFGNKDFKVACTKFWWPEARLMVKTIYFFCNLIFQLTEKISPSGSGACLMVDRKVFVEVGGFNESLRSFDDIEFIRRVGSRYGYKLINVRVLQSDRRYVEEGVGISLLKIGVMSICFALGKFKLAERIIHYEFGKHIKRRIVDRV